MQLHSWDVLKQEAINDKLSRRFVSGERITMALFSFAKGGTVPRHQHDNEQLMYVLEGALKLTVGEEEVTVRGGEVLQIPSGVPHGAVALENTVDLEVFSPVRSDWLAGK
ncbi:MAG: cupin domain-containing protein [Acidobacteriia bacterium]|nr:cupin domain-containing protein [Terriglobia bacterium]